MAKQTKLPKEVKVYVTQRLACFDAPSAVVKAIKDEFDIIVDRQKVEVYDPTKRAGQSLSKEFKSIFEETRKTFLEDTSRIGVSHKAVRLRKLDNMISRADKMGNMGLAAGLIEQAAKECGDAYSNKRKHELTGKNGESLNGGVLLVSGAMTREEWEKRAQEQKSD